MAFDIKASVRVIKEMTDDIQAIEFYTEAIGRVIEEITLDSKEIVFYT